MKSIWNKVFQSHGSDEPSQTSERTDISNMVSSSLDNYEEELLFQVMLESIGYNEENKQEEPQSENKTFQSHYKRAVHGIAESMFIVGVCYHFGVEPDLDINHKLAMEYYLKAALQGDYRAVNNLAIMAYNGDGMQKSEEVAIDLLEIAAKAHIYNSMMSLAVLRISATNESSRNYDEAFKILEDLLSNEQTSTPQAKNNIACCYARGFGCNADGIRALSLLKEAVNEGSMVAEYNEGVIILNGIGGVASDEHEGRQWIEEALSDPRHADYPCLVNATDPSKLLLFTTLVPCS